MSNLTKKLERLYDYDKGELQKAQEEMDTRHKDLPGKIERIAEITGIPAEELVSLTYKTDGPTFRWYDMIDRLSLMFNYRLYTQQEQIWEKPTIQVTTMHGTTITLTRENHVLVEGQNTFRDFTCTSLEAAFRLHEALQQVTQFT